VELYQRTQDAARRLEAEAAEIHELAKRLKTLTKATPSWYADMRARVEARAALEQAQELRQVLEELGERLGE
jgi:hypothetical protein